jgi:hypothetical protein
MTYKSNKEVLEENIDKLATIEHTRWSNWQKYLHSQCTQNQDGSLTIPASLVLHWNRQIGTHYDHLHQSEKDSDKKEVMEYWPIITSLRKNDLEAIQEWIESNMRRGSLFPSTPCHQIIDFINSLIENKCTLDVCREHEGMMCNQCKYKTLK